MDADTPTTLQQRIAYRTRAELVCCDIYGRVNDTHELTYEQAEASPAWHDICYWGEAAARIAEDPDGNIPDGEAYRGKANAPLAPETISVLRERLQSGDFPVRKVRVSPQPCDDGAPCPGSGCNHDRAFQELVQLEEEIRGEQP